MRSAGIKRIRPTNRAAPFQIPGPTAEAVDPFQQPAAKRSRPASDSATGSFTAAPKDAMASAPFAFLPSGEGNGGGQIEDTNDVAEVSAPGTMSMFMNGELADQDDADEDEDEDYVAENDEDEDEDENGEDVDEDAEDVDENEEEIDEDGNEDE
jgi:hypothetical protein